MAISLPISAHDRKSAPRPKAAAPEESEMLFEFFYGSGKFLKQKVIFSFSKPNPLPASLPRRRRESWAHRSTPVKAVATRGKGRPTSAIAFGRYERVFSLSCRHGGAKPPRRSPTQGIVNGFANAIAVARNPPSPWRVDALS
jgi:hypothetical protein